MAEGSGLELRAIRDCHSGIINPRSRTLSGSYIRPTGPTHDPTVVLGGNDSTQGGGVQKAFPLIGVGTSEAWGVEILKTHVSTPNPPKPDTDQRCLGCRVRVEVLGFSVAPCCCAGSRRQTCSFHCGTLSRPGFGLRVSGFGFDIWGFRVPGLRCRVQISRVEGLRFNLLIFCCRGQGLGSRVQGVSSPQLKVWL